MSDEKLRMDVPFERLHQRMVATVLAYEQAQIRKGVRVEKITITYDPGHEPYYDVNIQERVLDRRSQPVLPTSTNESDTFEELSSLEKD